MLISVTAGLDITASAASWTLVYEEGDIKIYQWPNGDYFYEDGHNHVTSFNGKYCNDTMVDILLIGQTEKYYPNTPPYSSGYKITDRRWSIDDTDVLRFVKGSSTNPATVMGVSPGETILTSETVWIWSNPYQYDSGTAITREAVRVVGWVEEVTLSDTQVTLAPGQTKAISMTSVKPNDVFTRFFNKLNFQSLNPDVATVDENGNITAVSPGTAEILSCTYYGGSNYNLKCSCMVTVTDPNMLTTQTAANVAPTASQQAPTATAKSTAKKPKSISISKLTKGKKQFKVTWKKTSGVTGYQIQYATDSKFKKNKTTVTVKGAKNTSKTIKKLKSKKKYYVRVRTYKTINGKKVYSSWSKVKSVKTK